MIQTSAVVYAVICAGVIVFQICLISGAPWGRLTQGGTHAGVLPRWGKALAGLSAILLVMMAGSILSATGLWPHWPYDWMGWATLAIQAVSALLNWITPSRPERGLWAPVTTVMLILAALALLG